MQVLASVEKSRLEQDLNPSPRDLRCIAPLIELLSQLGTGSIAKFKLYPVSGE